MRDNWLCPLRLRIIRIVVLETLKIRIWKALISVIFFIALINVLRQQLHLGPTSNELVQLKADFSEEEGKKKSFDVPGWSFGTSLSAPDYVDYFRVSIETPTFFRHFNHLRLFYHQTELKCVRGFPQITSLILPLNRDQDLSHFHAGNITTFMQRGFFLS